MLNIFRPLPFVLASTNHGTMIVNRNDYFMTGEAAGYGVGYQLLNNSSFDQEEVDLALALLEKRRINFGNGVVAIDCGANIGVHTIEWARFMYGWGEVVSFEAQEKIFYALAGNIAINNCLNVTAKHCAVGSECSVIEIPEPNYLIPSSYGSLELKESPKNEYIGQEIDYKRTKPVPLVSIDSLTLARLDFMKIDVEGMEEDVLAGARDSIAKHKPIIIVEAIKSDSNKIEEILQKAGYNIYPLDINILAIHKNDPMAQNIRLEKDGLWLN